MTKLAIMEDGFHYSPTIANRHFPNDSPNNGLASSGTFLLNSYFGQLQSCARQLTTDEGIASSRTCRTASTIMSFARTCVVQYSMYASSSARQSVSSDRELYIAGQVDQAPEIPLSCSFLHSSKQSSQTSCTVLKV